MPRVARKKSKSGIYHVLIRGINEESIFGNERDNKKFIEVVEKCQKEIGFDIYAYCLINNHVHLLIKEGSEEFSNTMRRIGSGYVYWYNSQYNRKGPLFHDRFKSEVVESDQYFLTVLRYIHQKPLKEGLTKDINKYKWSSYKEYFGKSERINTKLVLAMFNKNTKKAMENFEEFNKEQNSSNCLDVPKSSKIKSDKEIIKLVENKYDIDIAVIENEAPITQIRIIQYLKGLEGCSLRQLARLTGCTKYKIQRI